MSRFSTLLRPMALVGLVLAAIVSTSCDPKETVTPGVTVNVSEYSLPAEGGSFNAVVKTGASWNASVSGTWVSLSPMGGTSAGEHEVVITVSPNTSSPKERQSDIVFTSSGKTATLSIHQKGADIEDPTLPATALNVNFVNSDGGFTIENKKMPSPLTYVWNRSTSYGMVASARKDNVDYEAESWLISPVVDLTERRSAYLSFSHVFRYCNEKVTDQLQLKITKDDGKTWENLTIPKWPSGEDWNFISSGDIDLSAYCKNKVKIAFVYKSTEKSCPSWEIKTVVISREPQSQSDLGQSFKGIPSWLELPKISSDTDKFLIHAVKSGDKILRNYSMTFDTKALVAPWVAYPLCDSYTKKSVQRTDAWQVDPFLTEKEQPILYKSGDYFANGFERGHQIASADRLASTELNEQTFYYSNMAPMYKAEEFNSGVWGQLEDQVRQWSKSSSGTDTLYVVTGCVTKGSTLTVKDNNDKVVTVPSGFYKVLLRYSKSSTENGGYSGAAFYLEHKKYDSVALPKEAVMSIDALEEKLGMDFFPNLESKVSKDVAAKVEAENPTANKFWGLK